MNKICKELNLAKQYMLETIDHNGMKLVAITQDNVARVEAMIQNDAAYLNAGNVQFGPNKNGQGGSTAYWMCKLRDYIKGNQEDKKAYRDIIIGAVSAVDRDNSTHLNADGVGREEITRRICKIPLKKLIEYLKDPHGTDYELINIIAKKTLAPERSRENKSFASKFCHYACFYLFERLPEQDNYSIYDSILKNALPHYAKYYGIDVTKKELEDYVEYSKTIEKILHKTGNKISKNGFDHLLWYYFKGRDIQYL